MTERDLAIILCKHSCVDCPFKDEECSFDLQARHILRSFIQKQAVKDVVISVIKYLKNLEYVTAGEQILKLNELIGGE